MFGKPAIGEILHADLEQEVDNAVDTNLL